MEPPLTPITYTSLLQYGMKKLLAEGIGDIYQLEHIFRDNEYSMKHNPEFTMAEWYRINVSFTTMIQEFIGKLPVTKILIVMLSKSTPALIILKPVKMIFFNT